MTKPEWTMLPFKEMTAPVSAIAPGPGGVWAGGSGGVSWYTEQGGWTPPSSQTAVHYVTALAYGSGCLLAGHESGIARSNDGGKNWVESELESTFSTATGIVLSPRFAVDGVALAGTFGNGIFRTTDAGRSWRSSSFGLNVREVMALVWPDGDSVLAGTDSGLYQSPNGGRAWRVVPETASISFSSLASLPDGSLLAALTPDGALRFSPDLMDGMPVDTLPEGIQIWDLTTFPDGRILLGSGNQGLWVSEDSARNWTQIWNQEIRSLAFEGDREFAGTNSGLAISEDRGRTWTLLPPPPLHQLQWLLPLEDMIVLAGVHSSRVVRFADGDWGNDDTGPSPILGLWKIGARAYIAAASNGIFLCENGIDWDPVADEANCTMATFLGDDGWAGVSSDRKLLRTRDGGRTWEARRSPFGNLALVALQAFPNVDDGRFDYLMAATYDLRRRAVKVWRSEDGENWTPGADSYTAWPQVATLNEPAVVTIGSIISTRQYDGTWNQGAVGEMPFRRVVTDGSALYALALDAIWRSDDFGKSWYRDDENLPTDEILDIANFKDRLYVLLTGGRLMARIS
jgi:photosystem II stability/assembly factor-like uncharacterized protein